jgi:hypothetical protein
MMIIRILDNSHNIHHQVYGNLMVNIFANAKVNSPLVVLGI